MPRALKCGYPLEAQVRFDIARAGVEQTLKLPPLVFLVGIGAQGRAERLVGFRDALRRFLWLGEQRATGAQRQRQTGGAGNHAS